jgi:hypothetical protein
MAKWSFVIFLHKEWDFGANAFGELKRLSKRETIFESYFTHVLLLLLLLLLFYFLFFLSSNKSWATCMERWSFLIIEETKVSKITILENKPVKIKMSRGIQIQMFVFMFLKKLIFFLFSTCFKLSFFYIFRSF